MPRPCQVVRVFTVGDTGGNHLGVINDRSGLDERAMASIAADLGYSETVFVDWLDGPPTVRIFTPELELPFAGHPLVGAAWVLSRLGPAPDSGTLRCRAGDVRYRSDEDVVWIDAGELPADVAAVADASAIAAAAGLAAPHRAWEVTMPKDYLIFVYHDDEEVTAAAPHAAALADRFGLMLVHFRDDTDAHVRFFAPSAGVDEDPATGSAAVALAHALRHDGRSSGRLTIAQGAEIDRPSRIELSWSPERIEIGGTVARDTVRIVER